MSSQSDVRALSDALVKVLDAHDANLKMAEDSLQQREKAVCADELALDAREKKVADREKALAQLSEVAARRKAEIETLKENQVALNNSRMEATKLRQSRDDDIQTLNSALYKALQDNTSLTARLAQSHVEALEIKVAHLDTVENELVELRKKYTEQYQTIQRLHEQSAKDLQTMRIWERRIAEFQSLDWWKRLFAKV